MEGDSIFSNALEKFITNDGVKKKKRKNYKCEHGRDKYRCMDCGSSGSCEHKHDKRRCKICGGSALCEHGKDKKFCKECGGSQICEHGRVKRTCKGCDGNIFCEHGKVKYICKECDGSALCKHAKRKDLCLECGGASYCEHGKVKSRCKDCGGGSLCKHGKIKSGCRDCGGSSYCIHGKIKYTCKECGGAGICEHGNNKRICKECGGTAICEHGKCKSTCKQCGIGYCEHGREKRYCKECGGSQICPHNRIKRDCRECGGSTFCKHGKRKSRCLECGGSALCKREGCGKTPSNKKYEGYCQGCFMELFPDNEMVIEFVKKKERKCEHGIIKYDCIHCSGSVCKHGKWKRFCKECGGQGLCKSSWCEVQMNSISKKKYEGYCTFCFMHLFPDKKVARNYKTKEKDVVDRVKEAFPDFTWVHDKKVQDGCSKRRPDLLLDLGTHIVIVEIDENKHSGYDSSCENKRLMELSQDVHHRPIVFIRFNPDKYVDEDGNTVKSCWRMNKNGVLTIAKTKQEEWKQRIDVLKDTVQYWTDNKIEKTVEIIELFY